MQMAAGCSLEVLQIFINVDVICAQDLTHVF